eukprot:400482-Rhodomonas_salina.1
MASSTGEFTVAMAKAILKALPAASADDCAIAAACGELPPALPLSRKEIADMQRDCVCGAGKMSFAMSGNRAEKCNACTLPTFKCTRLSCKTCNRVECVRCDETGSVAAKNA